MLVCAQLTPHTLNHISNANIGEGELAFSAKSAVDIAKVVEHRKKCMPTKVATLKKRRSISLPDLDCGSATDASLPHSENTCPEPKLPADMRQHQCYPSPMKPQRQSVPIFPLHALVSTLSHDSVPGNDKIPTQPNSPQLPSPTTPSKCWKPIPPPRPWSRSASPDPSSESVSPHPDIGLSGSHSNNQTYTNETTPPTPKSPSNSARVLLPVPHHHIPTHSTKSDVGDSTKSSTASPKKVARFSPKEQVKVDRRSDSEPEGESRNETSPKSFMYLDKSAEDSGDYKVSDIEMGIDDLMVEKNMAYGVVEMGLGDKSSSVVTDLESSGYEYVDMGIGIGNGNSSSILVKKNLAYRLIDVGIAVAGGELDDYGYVDMLKLGGYDYVDMQIGNDQSSSIVEKNTAREPKSKRHGYMGESAPHIHKQSKAKIRRSNSDLSSRGSVLRKGTIKVYKDPKHTISTQRQLSVEDLTTPSNITPYATFVFPH